MGSAWCSVDGAQLFPYTWISLPDVAGRRSLPSHLSDFRRGERQILGFAPTSVIIFSKRNAGIFRNTNFWES